MDPKPDPREPDSSQPGKRPAGKADKPARPDPADDAENMTVARSAKETVESILIAFVLAFVFRAFIVEAFVIPTGSMATTLLGAHMRFTCRECGYRFDVGEPNTGGGSEIRIDKMHQGSVEPAPRCPNCWFKVPGTDRVNVPVFYGDRILVLKYLYIPWISSPNRWDVVVFKTPTDQGGYRVEPEFSQNYIKRLVGLPNEQLMILDGDVYVKHGDRWEVQAKTDSAQSALWRVVYDNDYRPLDSDRQDGWRFPWLQTEGSGWDTGDKIHARDFHFQSADGAGLLRFNPTDDERYFSDRLSYNAVQLRESQVNSYGQEVDLRVAHYTVSDVRLSFFYDRKTGDGPLRATLTKYNHQFFCELTPAQVRLIHRLPDGRERRVGDARPLKPGSGPLRVDFSNVDYQVTVRINGEPVIRTDPAEYAPDQELLKERNSASREVRAPLPRLSIEAHKQECVLSHLSIWRDIYYTPMDVSRHEPLLQGSPESPVKLGPDEYFVLGDNSSSSSDARFWSQTVELPDEDLRVKAGRVPGRFMLGKAFFVYWPAGFRPLKNESFSLIPNFGDMRLIR